MLYRSFQLNLPSSGTGYSDAVRLRRREPCVKITRVLIRHVGTQDATVATFTIAKHQSDQPNDWMIGDKVWEYSALSITGTNTTDLDHNTLAAVRGAPYPDDGN